MTDEQLEQRIAELRLQKAQLVDLMQHPGYLALTQGIAGQIRARRNAIAHAQLTSVDAVFKVVADQHEAAGLLLAGNVCGMILEDVEADLKRALELQAERDEEGRKG